MNHVDIILAIPLALGGIRGFSRGFAREAAALVGLVAGVFLAALFAHIFGQIVESLFDWNVMTVKIIVFIAIFVIVVFLVNMMARFVEKIFKVTGLNIFNRLAGVAAGVLKIAFVLSVFLIFFNYFNRNELLMSEKNRTNSFLYPKIEVFAPAVIPAKDFIVVQETIDRIKSFGEEEQDNQ